jgi:hypothetical protein
MRFTHLSRDLIWANELNMPPETLGESAISHAAGGSNLKMGYDPNRYG